MSQNGQGQKWIINRLLRLALVATEQVIGVVGLNAVLRRADLERFVFHLPPHDLDAGIALGISHNLSCRQCGSELSRW